ncbi:MAG: hypothetical protein IKP86_08675 [Anaerolineaceae bacterium]|nr:hypothetical protein [Anaerolineaceae bacterium]
MFKDPVYRRIRIILFCLIMALLAAGCGKDAPAPAPTVIPYTPEPEFDRDAAVFGGDVEMKDLSEYAEEFKAAGLKYDKETDSFHMPNFNLLRDALQGKNVRRLRLDDTLFLPEIGYALGRFGLFVWNLPESKAGALAEMENCRALIYYDSGNFPLPEDLVWPYLRSLSVTASQLSQWEAPISEMFPELRELVIRYDTIRTLDLAAVGLPETLESIEVSFSEGDMKEVPALYTAMTAKNISTVQFINGRPAGSFDPVISDQQKAEYERNLYLSDVISAVEENDMKDRGKTVKKKKPGISELQLPEGARIMCIHKKDLSSCSYNGDNEKILSALTDDPKACDVLFIADSISYTDPNVRVVGPTGSTSGGGSVRSLNAVDMASGEIYYVTMYLYSFYGSPTDQQLENNKLYNEKGLWGFIEPLF